jgi:hypothetical protein
MLPWFATDKTVDGSTAMRVFILACIATVVIATIGAIVLNSFQEPADVAFTTEGVRH